MWNWIFRCVAPDVFVECELDGDPTGVDAIGVQKRAAGVTLSNPAAA